ncbi:MAG: OmpA family protein [Pararhodobacter sp.]|nr:OmpA family protein [Pararhodobacter sp.]
MTRPSNLTLGMIAAFLSAAVLAVALSMAMAGVIERTNTRELTTAFQDSGLDWVDVQTDGLRVHLSGTAPTESARIRAFQVAGSVVDASRVTDSFEVATQTVVIAPVFRIEAMRNNDELSVIGLVPADPGDGAIIERLTGLASEATVSDMLQTADHPAPDGWVPALDFAIEALGLMPVSQVSVTADRIEVHALVESAEARGRLETQLHEMAPRDVVLMLDLVAPRPVIAPFTMRFVIDEQGARFDACAADSEASRDLILRAARSAGATDRLSCTIAMGSPSPRWGRAVELAIGELATLGAGVVTFSDGDLSLVAPATVSQSAFDRAVGRLETRLPDAFDLTAVLLEPEDESEEVEEGRTELLATLSEDGRLLVEGRLPDIRIRDSVGAFARARFGSEALTLEARLDPALPSGWSVRVLTVLEALAELHHGSATVRPDRVEVAGVSGNPDASAQVARILADGLGQGAVYAVRVRYDEALDPVEQAPTPERCEARVQAILAEDKITFAPGSATLDTDSRQALDQIADVLRECGALELEVAGHTDSQGRAETNLALSQARAEAVINALLSRRVLVSGMEARGYGSEQPIASNATADGREENRRIEMALIRPEPEPLERDPELEGELVFEIQSPDENTPRPAPRPGGTPPAAPSEDTPQDEEAPADEAPEDEAPEDEAPANETPQDEAPEDEGTSDEDAPDTATDGAVEPQEDAAADTPAATVPDVRPEPRPGNLVTDTDDTVEESDEVRETEDPDTSAEDDAEDSDE